MNGRHFIPLLPLALKSLWGGWVCVSGSRERVVVAGGRTGDGSELHGGRVTLEEASLLVASRGAHRVEGVVHGVSEVGGLEKERFIQIKIFKKIKYFLDFFFFTKF